MNNLSANKNGTAKKIAKNLLIVVIAVIVGIGILYGLFELEKGGSMRSGNSISINIPKGASTTQIASILKQNGLISSELAFRLYSKTNSLDGKYQYGEFTIKPGLSYKEIIATLQEINSFKHTIKVTFPEGYNAFQIAKELKRVGLVEEKEFLDALNKGSFDFDFIQSISNSDKKLVKLEGFLFPDTYEFYPDTSAEDIINTMLKNFKTKVLTEKNLKALENSGYTLEEWVIMASIVQKESANVKEMYNVASVFTNRLKNTSEYPKLQSCTTDDYREDYIQPFYEGKVPQDVDLAYDTYNREGLPVGAIANAGTDAFDAVLNPNDTPYYFFVTDVEYTHYYGKTYAEHQQNIKKALEVNKRYGKNYVDV